MPAAGSAAGPAAPVAPLAVDLGPGVTAVFTTRSGGSSTGPYASLNLATSVGDDPQAVAANRQVLAHFLGVDRVRFARQVHGTRVVDLPAAGADAAGEPECDALLTTSPGVALGVLVADCVPVLLADAATGVAAAVHAGRRGLAAGILQRCLADMARLGSDPAAVRAAVGPAIGGCCYEVPGDLQGEVAAVLPQAVARTRWGTPALDLPRAAAAVLHRLGVTMQRIEVCTAEDERFFSYRRSGVTGRCAGVVLRR